MLCLLEKRSSSQNTNGQGGAELGIVVFFVIIKIIEIVVKIQIIIVVIVVFFFVIIEKTQVGIVGTVRGPSAASVLVVVIGSRSVIGRGVISGIRGRDNIVIVRPVVVVGTLVIIVIILLLLFLFGLTLVF
jgi:hypothetical protein